MRFKLKNMAACRISFLSVFLFSVPFMYMWFNRCIFDYKRSKNSCCLFNVVVWYSFRRKNLSLNIQYVHNSWLHVFIYMVIVVMPIYANFKILNRLSIDLSKYKYEWAHNSPKDIIFMGIHMKLYYNEYYLKYQSQSWIDFGCFSISFCKDLD